VCRRETAKDEIFRRSSTALLGSNEETQARERHFRRVKKTSQEVLSYFPYDDNSSDSELSDESEDKNGPNDKAWASANGSVASTSLDEDTGRGTCNTDPIQSSSTYKTGKNRHSNNTERQSDSGDW
jgi:hypothetical protein